MNREVSLAQEAFVRGRSFLRDHPPSNPPANFAVQVGVLDDVISTLGQQAETQETGHRLSQADTKLRVSQRKSLIADHMDPVALIARAMLPDVPGLTTAVRVPHVRTSTPKLVAAAGAMANAVAPYTQVFVANGRPSDFVQQLRDAATSLQTSFDSRATSVRQAAGATTAMKATVKRGKQAVTFLTAIVRSAFKGNTQLLAEWENAIRLKPTGGGAAGSSSTSTNGASTTGATTPASASSSQTQSQQTQQQQQPTGTAVATATT